MTYPHTIKRILDIILALTMILCLAWLGVLIVLVYWIRRTGPVFFIQERLGKNQVIFNMVKFRTLSTRYELPVQERRFALGDFLRATNLDELPQLWNVLKGEMSLVGPRPLLPEYRNKFSAEQNIRHNVLPGITGLAQISGKNSIPWTQKLELDVEYVRCMSFRQDCLILLKTITFVLSMKRDVSLNEEKFSG